MALIREIWAYALSHQAEFIKAVGDHLVIVGAALGIAGAISLPLGVFAARNASLSGRLLSLITGLRVVPSLAVLFLVVPYLGLNTGSAIFALTLLAMPPIFINTHVAFTTLDPSVIESARGMGMTARQIFWRIEVPLAMPVTLAGIKTAATEVTASATLAAFVGSGGLGIYITRGFAMYDTAVLLLGAIPVALLTLGIEGLFTGMQRLASPPVQ